MTTSLSSLGYNMLKHFATRNRDYRMPLEHACKFDQRPFGSMLVREYIVYDRKQHGFGITLKGYDAFKEFETRGILRHIVSDKLTHYFEPIQPTRKRANIQPIKQIAASA